MANTRDVRPRLETDGELAQRIASAPTGAARDEEAALYRRFAPRVRLYGVRHLRDEAAAQDLVQEVLLVAIQRLRSGEVRKPEEIASFILGTSRVIAGSLIRKTRRRDSLLAQVPVAEAEMPSIVALDLARVERCLDTLADRDRAVLVLTFYGEKEPHAIAEALGTTTGAVRVARHRALDRLRECVGRRKTA